MLACARIGAVHSVVFGGFAAQRARGPDRGRAAEGRRLRLVRHRAGGASSRTSRCSTPRSSMVEAKPERCIVLQRPQLEAELDPGRDVDWDEAIAAGRAGRLRPGGGDRSALHPLHVGHDRAAEGDRPRQRRPRGRARVVDEATSTASIPARCTGRRRTSAGSSATPTSSTRRSCTAARPCCTRASRSARPTRARSGAWSPSTACRRCSPRRPRSARSGSRIRRAS